MKRHAPGEAGCSGLPRPGPLLPATPALGRSPLKHAQTPLSDPSPMMNCLSALVDCQRQAPASAATLIQAPVPPPPLVLASSSRSGSEAVSLEARSASNFHVGHPAGAGTSGRRACALEWRPVRPRRRFRHQVPGALGCRYCGSQREKKKTQGLKSFLLLFS